MSGEIPRSLIDEDRLWIADLVSKTSAPEPFIQDPKYNNLILSDADLAAIRNYVPEQPVPPRAEPLDLSEIRAFTAALRANSRKGPLEQIGASLDAKALRASETVFGYADKVEAVIKKAVDGTRDAVVEASPREFVAGALLTSMAAAACAPVVSTQASHEKSSRPAIEHVAEAPHKVVVPEKSVVLQAAPKHHSQLEHKQPVVSSERQQATAKLLETAATIKRNLSPIATPAGRKFGDAQTEALFGILERQDTLKNFDIEKFKSTLTASQLGLAANLSHTLKAELAHLPGKEGQALPLMMSLIIDSYTATPEQPAKVPAPRTSEHHAKPAVHHAKHEASLNIEHYTGMAWSKQDLEKIKANMSVYKHAAKAYDLPWQMLAVIHKREHNLALDNPKNGQGIYQFRNEAGKFAPGPVDHHEFQKQTMELAKRIRHDYAQRGMKHVKLNAESIDAQKVMDTFARYNGLPKLYRRQARMLGYSSHQAFMGSPYVVNRLFDATNGRKNPEWRQYRADGKNVRVANQQPGAWLAFKELVVISGDYHKLHNQVAVPEAPAPHVSHAEHEAQLNLPAKFSDGTVYYSQHDPRWRHKKYAKPGNTQTISASGCAPTAEAAAITTLTGETVTPDDMAQWNVEHGFRTDNSGTDHASFSAAPEAFGLQTTNVTGDPEAIKSTLQDGGMVIMNVKDTDPNLPGTSSGHVIDIRAVVGDVKSDNPDVRIVDPNSLEMSEKTFKLDQLLDDSHSTVQVAIEK